MVEMKKTQVKEFLKEREGRYKPTDPAVINLKRLNKIDFTGQIHLSDKSSKTNMIIVEPGDLVISGINVSKGAIAVYHGNESVTATIHYSSYQFDEDKIEIEYFKRFLKSKTFVQLLKEQVKGGIKTEIKPKHFLPLEISLPDIDSQKAIVSFFNRVENDMSALTDEIGLQHEYLKKLRQQILQEAIGGKLTAEWRKNNPELISGDNHASKLLEKIKAEKERLIKDKKIKKQKPLAPIADDEKPFDWPEGWLWCRLGDWGITQTGTTPSTLLSSNFGSYIPFIKPADISLKGIDYENEGLSENGLNEGRLICKNSVLMVCIGGSIGKSFFTDRDVSCNQQINSITPLAQVSARLLQQLLQSKYFQVEIWNKAMKSSTPIVNKGKWEEILIPILPLAEQGVILNRLDELMAMIDELEKQVMDRKEQSEMLMQSVLQEAFEG